MEEFTDAVTWIAHGLQSDGRISLAAKTSDQPTLGIPKKLALLLEQLPDEALTLTNATAPPAKAGPPRTWTLTGTPTSPIQLPMLPAVSLIMKDTVVTLTLGDKVALPPSYRFEVESKIDIGTRGPIKIKLTWQDKDSYNENFWELAIGPGADSGAEGVELSIRQLAKLLAKVPVIGPFIKTDAVTLGDEVLGVTIRATADEAGGAAKIVSVKVDGIATFLGFRCKLKLTLSKDDAGKLQKSLQLTWPSTTGETTKPLSSLLRVSLPNSVDVALKSFDANYDAQKGRLTITAVATRGDFTILIVRGRDRNKTMHTIAKLTWPAPLLFDEIPVIRELVHKGGLSDISVMVWRKEILVADACALVNLKTPVELVNFGLKSEEAEKKLFPPGVYAVGVAFIPDFFRFAFHLPLKQFVKKPEENPEHKKDDQNEQIDHKDEHKKEESKDRKEDDKEAREREERARKREEEQERKYDDDDEKKDDESEEDEPFEDMTEEEKIEEEKEDAANPPPATVVPVLRKFGPLSLNNISFKFENGSVQVLIDAELQVAVLTVKVMNLRAGFAFDNWKFMYGCDGGLISVERDPIRITGAMVHDTISDDYAGLLLVKIGEAFTLQAVGAMRQAEDPETHKALSEFFACGYFRGKAPLIKTPWFDITGLVLGFGINRAFKVPRVDAIDRVPFVQIAQGRSRLEPPKPEKLDRGTLWKLMTGIRESVPGSPGQNFVTAGFTATSFGIADSVVLANVAFGHSLEIVILGRSIIEWPKGAPVGRLEINLEVVILPEEGFVGIAGAFGSGSYFLSKNCLLTGEFALNAWFAGQHEADFVFSFGGYHPHYTPPKHYPQLPRIGAVWKIDDNTTATLSAYFTITPGAIMAGLSFNLVFVSGPIRAWCHIEANFLLEWLPFHYDIDVYIDLGVSLRCDLGFVSFTITLEVSVKLGIWGPDFTGRAEVNLSLLSFDFDFGANAPRDDPKRPTWLEFSNACLPTATETDTSKHKIAAMGGAMPELDSAPSARPLHDIVALDGIKMCPAHASDDPDWLVDPHHVLINIVTKVPAKQGKLNGTPLECTKDIMLGVRPLGSEHDGLMTVLSVDIKRVDGEIVHDLKAELLIGQVPAALWGIESEKGETVPAITAIRFFTVPHPPDQTAQMSFEVVGYEDEQCWYAWERPAPVPNNFVRDTSAPAVTIGAVGVVSRRNALLQEIFARGLFPSTSSEAPTVDVSSIQGNPFCFMAPLPLCRLGAEELAA